MLLEPPN
jgi:hypothetical protein